MQIRMLKPHEVNLHRELRLRALQDAPDSFGETFADVAAKPMDYWDDMTRTVTGTVTAPGRHVMFLACKEGAVHGSVYGLLDRERKDGGRVGGMWVDPAWRQHGIGRAMLNEVLAWAREHQLKRLGLWVPSHRPEAVALYSRAGFYETGGKRALPTNAALQIIEMACEL